MLAPVSIEAWCEVADQERRLTAARNQWFIDIDNGLIPMSHISERTLREIEKGREVQQRKSRLVQMDRWQSEGRIKVVWQAAYVQALDHNKTGPLDVDRVPPDSIVITCGDEVHVQSIKDYPSPALVAQLALKLQFDETAPPKSGEYKGGRYGPVTGRLMYED